MRGFDLEAGGRVERVLLLGAHADDVEIGCGGTILRLVERNPSLQLRWVVLSATGARRDEAMASAAAFSEDAAGHDVVVGDLRDGFLPYDAGAAATAKELVEAQVAFAPDVVFAPHRHDRHQDHRLVSDLAWNSFRDHLVLEYEIPKYDGDLGTPNVFVPLTDELAQRKAALLAEHFPSQRDRHWFTTELFLGVLRLRGMECRSPWAEAFHGRKVVWS